MEDIDPITTQNPEYSSLGEETYDEDAVYSTVKLEPPTREGLLSSYQQLRDAGGPKLVSIERQLGIYIEAPSLKERIIKVGSATLSALGFK